MKKTEKNWFPLSDNKNQLEPIAAPSAVMVVPMGSRTFE